MKKVLFSVLLFVAVVSCQKDEEEPKPNPQPSGPTKLLTFVPTSVSSVSKDNQWVIIHDKNGNPLEYTNYGTDEVTIETTKTFEGNAISITVLRRYEGNGFYSFYAETYTDFQVGTKFTEKANEIVEEPKENLEGSFTVTTRIPGRIVQYGASNKFGRQSSSGISTISGSGSSITSITDIGDYNDYLYQFSDAEGNLGYKMLMDVKAGDVIDIPYEEFLPFDNVSAFNFPSDLTQGLVLADGREAGQSIVQDGYWMNYLTTNQVSGRQLRVGYIKSLTNYKTIVIGHSNEITFGYVNAGSIPAENVTWPSPSEFSVQNKSIQNFECSASTPVISQRTAWQYRENLNGFTWSVESLSRSYSIKGLPAELVQKYPILNIGNLGYIDTTFYIESPNYKELIPSNSDYYIVKYIAL